MTITIDGPNETIEHDGELSIDGDGDIDIESLNLSETFTDSLRTDEGSIEQAQVGGFDNIPTANVSGPLAIEEKTNPPEFLFAIESTTKHRGYPFIGHKPLFTNGHGGSKLWYQTATGEIEPVGSDPETGHTTIQRAAFHEQGFLLVLSDGDGYVYTPSTVETGSISPTDADFVASNDGVNIIEPWQFSIVPTTGPSWEDTGFVWAGYNPDGEMANIYRWGRGLQGFEVTLSFDPEVDDIRHWHGTRVDPHTRDIWAFSGDGIDESGFWRSGDYGRTNSWTDLGLRSADQSDFANEGARSVFRTLSLTFTEDHVYWASDSRPIETNGDYYGGTFRADKADVAGTFEHVSTFDRPDVVSYGSARCHNPNGMIIITQVTQGDPTGMCPIYFHSFETEELFKIAQVRVDGDEGSTTGIRGINPLPVDGGEYYLDARNVVDDNNGGRVHTRRLSISSLPHLKNTL